MDEELEQPKKKITLSNFFESIKSIDEVANNALKIANSNISIIQDQKSIIEGLSQSLEALQTEIQEINNYIIIEKNEREDRRFEEEDRRQKEEMSQRRAAEGEKGERGPRGPQGTQGESEEKKEPQGGGGGLFGGLLGALTGGIGALGLNFATNIFTGFRGGGPLGAIAGALGFGKSGAKGFEAQDKLRNRRENLFGDNQKITKPRGLTGIFGGMADALTGGRTDFDGRGSGEKEKIKEGKVEKTGTGEDEKEGGKMTPYDFIQENGLKITDLEDGFNRIVHVYNPDVQDKDGNYQGIKISGTFKGKDELSTAELINAHSAFEIKELKSITKGLKKDKKVKDEDEIKPEKKEGRGIKGVIGGVADTLTGGIFDFDKRGSTKLQKFGQRGGVAGFLSRKIFGDKKRKKSNPDRSPDRSIETGTLIGGELYKPGEEMSLKQRLAIQAKIMINGEDSVDPQELKDYKNSGGPLSEEEASQISDFEGYEPGAVTEVSEEEARRQIEAEDNPFAGILSPFVDKFKNFAEGLEKSSLGESLKDEKIPKQLESVAKDIGSKIDPKDIKDVVIKTVVKKLFGDIEPGAFSPVTDEDIEREKQLDSNSETYELSGASKELIGGDKDFLKAVKEVSEKRGMNQAEFLGAIASESGLDPKAVNKDTGATGLMQFLPEVAESLGTTTDKISEMSRAEQVKLIDKYFDMNKLPDNPTAGQLKTNILMPAYTDKGDDFELMTKFKKFTDGETGNPNTFSQNKGLDYNEDGFVTVGEAGESIMKKMKEFGIKDVTPQKGGIDAVIENKVEDLSQNILSNFEETSLIGNNQPQIDPDAALQINQSFLSESRGDTRPPTLLQPEMAQVSEASLKNTETTSTFVQTISNNKINIVKKTALPSEIARMIL